MFDRRALPSLALALAVLALGSLDNPSVLAVSERSNSLFWASKKVSQLSSYLFALFTYMPDRFIGHSVSVFAKIWASQVCNPAGHMLFCSATLT